MNSKAPAIRRCTECKEYYQPKRYGLKILKQCSEACIDVAIGKNTDKPKQKPKKKPLKKLSKLKKELWDLFSLHQKIVHSEDGESCNCYTCDAPLVIGTSNCQGGHNLSKAGNPNIWFDERCVRPQCNKCNSYYGGMHYEFNERLKQEIGIESWQEMYDNRKLVVKRSRDWYLEKIEYYGQQIKLIKNAKSQ